MKKGILLSLLILLSLSIQTGCKMLDITKEFELVIDFDAYSAEAVYSDQQIFDATENSSEMDEYSDNIKKIEIQEVTAELTSFSGPTGQQIALNTLSVADEDGANEYIIGTVTDQDLESLQYTPVPITINQDGIDRFAKLLKERPHKALVKNAGSSNVAPINCVIRFRVTVKMTANPL